MKVERLAGLPAASGGGRPGREGSRRRAVGAVGNFDGVHRGHQSGLRLACEEARRSDAEFVAVTFDPHPARLIRPDRAPRAITSLPLKTERLAAAGVARLVVIEFGEAIAVAAPADFVERLLAGHLNAAAVVQGANFRFGRERSGDLATLRKLGARHGFRVIEAPSVTWEGGIISSTRIRAVLGSADLEAARALLGAAYEIEGPVVRGRGRGRELGFPTANLELDEELLLPHGVYAADAVPEPAAVAPLGAPRRAVVHYGPRPTFREEAPSLEVHIPGFSGRLARLRLRFWSRLRGVRSFDGPEALRRQLERDAARAREFPGSSRFETPPPSAEALAGGSSPVRERRVEA